MSIDVIWETDRGKKEYQLRKVVYRPHPKAGSGHAITIKIQYGLLFKQS